MSGNDEKTYFFAICFYGHAEYIFDNTPEIFSTEVGAVFTEVQKHWKKNSFFSKQKTFFPKLCLWTPRMPFWGMRKNFLRWNAKIFCSLYKRKKSFPKTKYSKCSFGQSKSGSDSGYEKNSAKDLNIITKCQKTIEKRKQEFFKEKASSNFSHDRVEHSLDTLLKIVSSRTANLARFPKRFRKKVFSKKIFLKNFLWAHRTNFWRLRLNFFEKKPKQILSGSETDQKIFQKNFFLELQSDTYDSDLTTPRKICWQMAEKKMGSISKQCSKNLLFSRIKVFFLRKCPCICILQIDNSARKSPTKYQTILAQCPKVTIKTFRKNCSSKGSWPFWMQFWRIHLRKCQQWQTDSPMSETNEKKISPKKNFFRNLFPWTRRMHFWQHCRNLFNRIFRSFYQVTEALEKHAFSKKPTFFAKVSLWTPRIPNWGTH